MPRSSRFGVELWVRKTSGHIDQHEYSGRDASLLGKYDQAESLGAKTVELRLRALGEEHPATLRSQGGLAITYREQERYAQAESLFNKILSVQRRLHRESAPETLGAQQELALLYRSQGRNPEADALLTAVLERRRSALGSEHPITIATLTPLGWIKLQQRDFESSRTLLQEALKAHEKANADTWQRSYCQSLLGAALMGQKNTKKPNASCSPAINNSCNAQERFLTAVGPTWSGPEPGSCNSTSSGERRKRQRPGAKNSAMRPASPPPRPVRAKSSWV